MPIIPISPTPAFGADNFPSIQGLTITGAFSKFFAANPSSTLTKAECEDMFNNEESIITP